MSSDNVLKLILGIASAIISLITLIGGFKEGKESFRQLNEHLDKKEKETRVKEYTLQGAHQYR